MVWDSGNVCPSQQRLHSRAGLSWALVEEFSLHMAHTIRAKTGQLQSNKYPI